MAERGTAIRRRRRCESCGHRFTTFERIEPVGIVVVKSDGRSEPFDPAKIAAGVRAATKGRGVDDVEIEQLALDVEDEVRAEGAEVASSRIGIAVLERLRARDEVAYVRFASVYKHFDGAADFATEVALLRKADPAPG